MSTAKTTHCHMVLVHCQGELRTTLIRVTTTNKQILISFIYLFWSWDFRSCSCFCTYNQFWWASGTRLATRKTKCPTHCTLLGLVSFLLSTFSNTILTSSPTPIRSRERQWRSQARFSIWRLSSPASPFHRLLTCQTSFACPHPPPLSSCLSLPTVPHAH